MVSVDPYLNETTRHADVILPPPDAARAQPLRPGLLHAVGAQRRQLLPRRPRHRPAERCPSTTILARLALIASGQGADADPAHHRRPAARPGALLQRRRRRRVAARRPRPPRSWPTQLVADDPPGPAGRRHAPHRRLRRRVRRSTPTASPSQALLDQPARHRPRPAASPGSPGPQDADRHGRAGAAELIVADIARMLAPRSTAHRRRRPAARRPPPPPLEQLVDAQRRRAGEGQGPLHPAGPPRRRRPASASSTAARPRSRHASGTLVAPVEVTDEVMAGVVSLPHGWGHDHPGTPTVRRRHATRASTSTCSPTKRRLDPLSGNAVLNGIPVTVAPA